MKRLLLLVALLPLCVLAQVVRQPLSVQYAGLGAYSKNFADLFSGTSNQASLASLKQAGFGAYGESRFLLQELNQYSAVVAIPTSSGTVALQADYFGSSALNESQLGLAYARTVAAQMDVGIKFNYCTLKVPGYGNAAAINFEAGALIHLSDRVHTGFHVYNPLGSKFGKNSNEKLPAIVKTGLGYEPSEKVFIGAEIVKQEDQPVTINMGLQYNVQQKVLLRLGVSTATSIGYAGVGLQLGQLRIDVNSSYHPQLGLTPGLLLLYHFKKAEAL